MIVVVNYGIGNVFSIINALKILRADAVLSSDKAVIEKADKIILPGVGFFKEAVKNIEESGLKDLLIEKSKKKTSILGICIGMQILFEESEESPGIKGLNLLRGKVKKLPSIVRVPHMGWNTVHLKKPFPFKDMNYFYFAHSYYCYPEKEGIILGETFYGISFPSIVRDENIWGVQFHPEKSGKNGIEFLRRWLNVDNTSN